MEATVRETTYKIKDKEENVIMNQLWDYKD